MMEDSLNNREIIQKSIKLCKKSCQWLAPLLQEKELKIYADDENDLAAFPFGSYSVVEVPVQGSFYVDDIRDYIKDQLRKQIPWETEIQQLIKQFVIPGSIVIDIGAHIGMHTIAISKCVGDAGKVFAFEPYKKLYRELCMNLALNHCENVIPIRCAIGKQKDTIQVVPSNPFNEGGAFIKKGKKGINNAVIMPLDAFRFTNVSLIKIDVENMESDVIDGAFETISKSRPIMLIEIQGNEQRALLLKENSLQMKSEAIAKIEKLDYRLEFISLHDYIAFPK